MVKKVRGLKVVTMGGGEEFGEEGGSGVASAGGGGGGGDEIGGRGLGLREWRLQIRR